MNVLSLFSGCGGMDIGFEGDFWCLKKSINTNIHPDWIIEEKGDFAKVAPTKFKTVFANDIREDAKQAWITYFGAKKQNVEEIYHLDSIVDLVKRADQFSAGGQEMLELGNGENVRFPGIYRRIKNNLDIFAEIISREDVSLFEEQPKSDKALIQKRISNWIQVVSELSKKYKPLTTQNKSKKSCFLNVGEWKNFVVGNILNCDTTILSIKDDLLDGSIPFISRTAGNNGCDGYVEVADDYLTEANCVTIGAEGIYAFYQPEKFATGNKVYALKNKHMNQYVGLFLSTILNKEDYRYSYGRARILGKLKAEQIKLPVKHNADGTIFIDDEHTYSEEGYVPDWQFMENYIRSLPYGDRLEDNNSRKIDY